MFTGIIEEVGQVVSLESRPAGQRLRIGGKIVTRELREGDSVSVNGVCLTAVDLLPGSFGADVSPETLKRTSLAAVRAGDVVNLERPLTPDSRLGGHIVQGHVDGLGEVVSLDALGADNWWLSVRYPPELDRYFVFKGSVSIDGISLTIAAVEQGVLSVTIIPHTYRNTNLHRHKIGDPVNLECDVLAKYVEKMMGKLDPTGGKPLSLEKLRDEGY